MQTHGPKRVYTPQSLEFWFEKLAGEWEPHFSPEQLEAGHRIYRDGEVRELELTAQDAIVHRRVEKKDEYAVIEWRDNGLAVRSSSTDPDIAHALAVAGLHEIEELVADEISPLPEDQPASANGSPAAPANGNASPALPNGKTNGHSNGHSNGHATAPASTPGAVNSRPAVAAGASPRRAGASSSRVASRSLILVFKTRSEGLSFQAYWQSTDKKRVAALGAAVHADGNGHVTSGERAKLIGLAAYARKAHFQYQNETGVYLLENVTEIPNFLKGTLAAWRRLFAIELDAAAGHLIKGTRTIEIEAVADRRAGRNGSSGEGLDLRWIFKAGEQLLSDAEVKALLKRGTSPTILPSVGIVALPTEQLAAIDAWRRNVAETHAESALSPYLIFSLFNDTRFKLTLSPELEAWRSATLPAPRRRVAAHLCDVGCHGLLADEMGLGKTVQVISLISRARLAGRQPRRLPGERRAGLAGGDPPLLPGCTSTCSRTARFHQRAVAGIWLASYAQLRNHRALLDEARVRLRRARRRAVHQEPRRRR
jgi:hypothetical protein